MERNIFSTLRHVIWLGIVAASCAGWGCSSAASSQSANGTVTVDGKPVSGVYIVIHDAATKAAISSACTRDGGHFSWTVSEPGEYLITAFWPQRIETEEETIEGPDQLRGKYRNVQKPVAKVTIVAGENTLPSIELARK